MKVWTRHYLNAREKLDPHRDRVEEALVEVARRAEEVVEPLPLDIVVQTRKNGGIPEIGHVGYAPGPGVIMVILDPDNPNLVNNMGEAFERMIAHELHHALRWESVGYGSTLGEVLVSEGLAGRFVQELYNNEGELWETAVRRDRIGNYAWQALEQVDSRSYDHPAWFFGRGGLPRWLGDTLGWEIVGEFLREHAAARPSKLAAAPAKEFYPYLKRLSDNGS